MTGAWACSMCAERLALGSGHARHVGGWCGAGGHVTTDVIGWHPEAIAVGRRQEPKVAAPAPRVSSPVQGSLF